MMTVAKKLRIAVIGAGRLGSFHAQKLAACDDVELVGVVDPLAENCRRVAAECRCPAFSDHRELFGRLDGVVIAAPAQFHHTLGLQFLSGGVHVLMEKRLAARRSEAEQLVAVARQMGAVLQVGHVERFNPALEAAAPCMANPKYVEAVRAGGFTFRSTDVGVVLDLMIHDLDLVLAMARSPVTRVDALGLSVLGSHEDVANARLEFECGCVAVLSASRVSRQAVRRMKIWSQVGLADVDFAARTTTLTRPSETLLGRRFDVDSLTPEEVEHYREHLLDEHLPCETVTAEPVDVLSLELADFVQSIRKRLHPRVTGEHGRDAVAVAEEILARIHAHAWDDDVGGPVGPMAVPRPSVIPAPHWSLKPGRVSVKRKEAG